MSSIPEQIEEKLRPILETEAGRIASQFSFVTARVVSFVGSSNGRYVLSLECLLTTAAPQEADVVALCITMENLDKSPTIFLDISWGDPSGCVEAELFERPLPLSDITLKTIETALPDFFQKLHRIIEHGKPSI